MDVYLKKIKSYYKNISKKNISYDRPLIKPFQDWFVILIFWFISMIFVTFFSLYLYNQINNGNFFSEKINSSNNSIMINNNLLKKTIENLDTKKAIFEETQKNKIVPTDPSM